MQASELRVMELFYPFYYLQYEEGQNTFQYDGTYLLYKNVIFLHYLEQTDMHINNKFEQ